MKLETVTKTALLINGWLLDTVRMRHWYETKSWGPHHPAGDIRAVERYVKEYWQDQDVAPGWKLGLLVTLSFLNNQGFYIPNEVFRYPPTTVIFYEAVFRGKRHIIIGRLLASHCKGEVRRLDCGSLNLNSYEPILQKSECRCKSGTARLMGWWPKWTKAPRCGRGDCRFKPGPSLWDLARVRAEYGLSGLSVKQCSLWECRFKSYLTHLAVSPNVGRN